MLGHREMTKTMFHGYGCCSRKSLACAILLLCTAWGPLGKGWVVLICFSFFFFIPCDRYGHFSGINRKVQLTYLPHGHLKAASEDEGKET